MIVCVDGLEGKEKYDYIYSILNQFQNHFFHTRNLDNGPALNEELDTFLKWCSFCYNHSNTTILSNYSPLFSFKHFPQLRPIISLFCSNLELRHVFIELKLYEPDFPHTHLGCLNEMFRNQDTQTKVNNQKISGFFA